MTMMKSDPLDAGEYFPRMGFITTEDQTLELPAGFSSRWGVLLFYRGDW